MTENSRPRIVVTVSDPGRNREPGLAARKNELYAEALRRQGAEPVLLDTAVAPDARGVLLAAMDGLLLSGGPDLDPALYRPPARAVAGGSAGIERDRDELERAAWLEAERRGIPVLGICRGLQAVNVFSGGDLIQHVGDHQGPAYGHGEPVRHRIRVEPGTRLAGILRSEPTVVVNSYHHQAVGPEQLAPTLKASAWGDSEDGPLVEALESPEERWLVAVQCHPERRESTPDAFDRLWAGFVQAARDVRAR